MKTYNLINDLDSLNAFVDWLPDTNQDEYFYGYLLARKKYDTENVILTNK